MVNVQGSARGLGPPISLSVLKNNASSLKKFPAKGILYWYTQRWIKIISFVKSNLIFLKFNNNFTLKKCMTGE